MSVSALRNALVLAVVLALASGCGDDAPSSEPDVDTSGDVAGDADTLPPDDSGSDAAPDEGDDGAQPDGAPQDAAADVAPDVGPDDDTSPDAQPSDASPELPPQPVCGDGHLDEGETCDDGELNSDTTPDACRTDCVPAHCGDGVVDTGEACDDGNDNPFDGCTPDCQPGAGLAAPLPGDLVITELHVNPQAVNDPFGEWIELHNTTDEALDLTDCLLYDDATDLIVLEPVDGPVAVAPGDHFVLGFSGDPEVNGGVAVDYVYATMLLDNFGDTVTVECGGVVIDSVTYQVGAWPIASGVALALDPGKVDAALNDSPFSWCAASSPFGDGDLGTPGAPNDPCPVPDTTVDLCVLRGAPTATGFVGHPMAVQVEIVEAGITDLTPGVDLHEALIVEVGHAPAEAAEDPAAWQWTSTAPVGDWEDLEGVDAWQGPVTFDATGDRVVAARASRDGGLSWTLCDLDPGSADGFAAEDAIAVAVVADPCIADPCADAPAPVCQSDGVSLWSYPGPALCVPVAAGAFECEWLPSAVDCSEQGAVCVDGACGGTAVAPEAGEVVFTELLVSPAPSATPWVELTNLAPHPVSLEGCQLSSGASVHVVNEPVVLGVGAAIVLASSADAAANGGLAARYAWGTGLTLAAAGPGVSLSCGGAVVDHVAWTSQFGFTAGVSKALSPFHLSAQGNDDPAAWCAGVGVVGQHVGTPGAENPPCPGDVEPVDACRIAAPATSAGYAGASVTIEVRFVEAGLTDAGPGNAESPAVRVEVAIAPAGTAAESDAWSWTTAAPVADWDAPAADEDADVDAWSATVRLGSPGVQALGARVSVDGGNTWTYCDLDAETPFNPAEAPLVEAEEGPCWPDPCGVDPGTVCLGDFVGEVVGAAECRVEGEAAVCTWPAEPAADCAAEGARCVSGACVDYPGAPGEGQVVFTELLVVPEDPVGEWVELTNVTEAPLDLAGCELVSGPDERWTVSAPGGGALLVWPGEPIVLARTGDAKALAGVVPQAVWADLSLANAADFVGLACGEVVVDEVGWDTQAGWTVPAFTTLSLSADATDATANDEPSAWCAGTAAGGGAPAGTPGQLNPECP